MIGYVERNNKGKEAGELAPFLKSYEKAYMVSRGASLATAV